MSWNLQKEIKEILATEIGTQIFAPGRRTPVAFLYPNTYHLGMSNLGLHILYQILNRDGWACERVFLPEERKREEYAKTKTALFSMETQRPLADFPYICATLSFEMDYLNFLIQLQMGHIKLLSEERGEKDPFVIIGGPCATFNPEPLADFADFVVIGEGEETLPKLLRLLEQLRMEKKTRREKLLAAAQLPGVYVPQFYAPILRQSFPLIRNLPTCLLWKWPGAAGDIAGSAWRATVSADPVTAIWICCFRISGSVRSRRPKWD